MLHLRGADTEGQRPEGAVGGGVGIAADDGHPRLGQSLLGADDVHDALAGGVEVVERNPVAMGVLHQQLHLAPGDRVGDRQVPVAGGHIVVHGGHGQVGAPHPAPGQSQPLERLRRGDLMHQVQVDVEQPRLVPGRFLHQVRIPELAAERATGHPAAPAGARRLAAAGASAWAALPSSVQGIMARSLAPTCSIW